MEMVLLGLGGCNGFDVVKLLKEAGQDVVGVELQIEAERAVATPAVFTRIKGLYTVTGRGLDESEVKKAVAAVGAATFLGVEDAREDRAYHLRLRDCRARRHSRGSKPRRCRRITDARPTGRRRLRG